MNLLKAFHTLIGHTPPPKYRRIAYAIVTYGEGCRMLRESDKLSRDQPHWRLAPEEDNNKDLTRVHLEKVIKL